MRDELRLNPDCTLYSTCSSFVSEGIRQGKDPFDLEKMTRHGIEIASHHYVRSQIHHKKDELTRRNWTPKRGTVQRSSGFLDICVNCDTSIQYVQERYFRYDAK